MIKKAVLPEKKVQFIDPRLQERVRRVSEKRAFWLHREISTGWIKALYPMSRSAILVGITLRFLSILTRKNPIKLTTIELSGWGLSRQMKWKGLRELEEGGLIKVQSQRGKNPVVLIIDKGGSA